MDTINVFKLAFKLAPYFLGGFNQSNQSNQNEAVSVEQSTKDKALMSLKNKDGSVTVLIGSRDTGKTELALRVAEFFNRPTYMVSPQQKPPKWVTHLPVKDLLTVPPWSTMICDDLPAYMSNKDYSEEFSKNVEKCIPMVRHEPQPPDFPVGQVHLIFCTQSASQADKYILDCDAAFLKPLGLLMDDVERSSVSRLMRLHVNPLFDGQSDEFVHRHAYMITRQYKGLIEFKKTR